MKYADAESFRAALEARLRQAAAGDQDFARRRRTVAFDRFLARLAIADHGAWVLKGGAAIEFRMPERARATRDIDLAFDGALDPAGQLNEDMTGDPFGDYFSFRVTRRRELSDAPDRGIIVRLSLDAVVGSRIFERFVVDLVGQTGAPATTERVKLGVSLSFADLPVVEMAVIDLATHWAEKLSAYLRRYDDRPNTRVKDLVDLALLIEHGLAPDSRVRDAVEATFTQRRQQLPTAPIPSMAEAWAAPYAEMAAALGLAATTAVDAHDLVEDFWNRAQAARSTPGGNDRSHPTN